MLTWSLHDLRTIYVLSLERKLKQSEELTSTGEVVKVTNMHEIRLDLLNEIRHRKAELDTITEVKVNKKLKELCNLINEY